MKKLMLSLVAACAATVFGGLVQQGATQSQAGADEVYTWTANGSVKIPEGGQLVDLLIVGGGGGGGGQGGGGGGGVAYYQKLQLPAGTYLVTIGAGGSKANDAFAAGGKGGASKFGGLFTVLGGGGGSGWNTKGPTTDIANGGGGTTLDKGEISDPAKAVDRMIGIPGIAAEGQVGTGYKGGNATNKGSGTTGNGGGGGGAGAGADGQHSQVFAVAVQGDDTPGEHAGNGGDGYLCAITGTGTYYGGGGGGGIRRSNYKRGGLGGLGGGGNGGGGTPRGEANEGAVYGGSAGVDGLGGGGGAASWTVNPSTSTSAGVGGSGVVILRVIRENDTEVALGETSFTVKCFVRDLQGADAVDVLFATAPVGSTLPELAIKKSGAVKDEVVDVVADGLTTGVTYAYKVVYCKTGTSEAVFVKEGTALTHPPLNPLESPVWVSGLKQAKFNSSYDKASGLADSKIPVEATPGPVMADLKVGSDDEAASKGWANPYTGTTYYYNSKNTTFAYIGYIWLEAGVQYNFTKNIDDSGYIKIGETVVIDDGGYQSYPVEDFKPEESGWYAVDMRCGDGSGGKGPSGGAVGSAMGFGYNKDGVTKQQATGWNLVRDAGNDGSFLRTEDPKIASMMSISSLKKSGSDVVFFASFENVLAKAELRAYYDVEDRGDTPALWANYVKVAEIGAGATDVARYVATGAANGFVRIALVVTGTDTVQGRCQFTEATAFAGDDPIVSVSVESVGYTNATVSVTVATLGGDATEATVTLHVSKSEDMSEARAITLDPKFTDPGTRLAEIAELLTNTTYYVRASAVNNAGNSAMSSVKDFLTLTPTDPAGEFLIKSTASTSQTFFAMVTDLGDDSHSAVITMQCATDEDFTEGLCESDPLDIGEDDLDVEKELTVSGLQKNTPYYSRLKIVNGWGLTYYAETFFCQTLDSLVVQGIGYTAVEGGFNVDVVVSYMDGDSATVELFANGVSVGTQELTAAGKISFAVSSAADLTALRAVVTGGITVEKTVSAKKGTTQIVVDTLAGHDTAATAFVLNVGDKVSLPGLIGKMKFENLSGHRFLKLENGEVTALEPGIGAVEQYDVAGALATTAVFLIKPDMQEGGRVFIYRDDVNQAWSKPGTWVQVGVGTNTEVPNDKTDVVFIPSLATSDKTVSVDGAYSIQDLFIGRPVNSKREFRIQGSSGSGCSLAIYGAPVGKSDYRPGILMTASAVDGTADHNACFRVSVGGVGSGNKLFVELPHGLDVDLGGPATKSYGPADYANSQRIRFSYAVFNIGTGLEMTLKNGPNSKYNQWGGDDQAYNVAHEFGGSGSFVGNGSLVIATPGDFVIGGSAFNAFEGRLVDAQRNFVTRKECEGNGRSGAVHSLIGRAEKMAMTLAGYQANDFSITKGVGVFTAGNLHGYGDPNSALENTIPERELRMEGGILRLYGMNKSWSAAWTNFAQKIVIADGLSYINVGVSSMANDIRFGDVDHPGDGTLYVNEPRTYNNNTTAKSTLELDGLDNWYVGNADKTAEDGDVYPIVPWFLVKINGNVWEPWWGYVNADGQMQRGLRESVALNSVTTAGRNVYSAGNNLTIDHDVTVNSLALNDNGKTMTMGEGRKITIASGGLILYNSKSSVGTQSGGSANGTLEFTNKAYIHATTTSASDPNQIWATILAREGVVLGYIGNLVLGGDQTGIDKAITVNNGGLYLGSMDGKDGCQLDVPINLVGGNTKLVVNQADTIKELTLNLSCPGGYGPKITVPAAGEKCLKVYVDGQSLPRGTYGALGSGAQFESEYIAEGSGFLTVRKDDLAHGMYLIIK